MKRKKGLTSGISKNRAAGKVANLERIAGDESFQACKGKAFNTPVRITVISYRSRLADADGVSAKAAIDGLVHSGILKDDSPKEVVEVRHVQHKVKNKEDERTEIEIEAVK
jgi:Holliday junction resolvase RusA-like endonuclease